MVREREAQRQRENSAGSDRQRLATDQTAFEGEKQAARAQQLQAADDTEGCGLADPKGPGEFEGG